MSRSELGPGWFTRRRAVRDRDIDQYGHVNNLVWLRFTLELATAHSDAAGWDEARYREAGVLWIVHRHEIDYLRPALPGEEIEESTWIDAIKGARCVRASRFSRAGQTLVDARTTWVMTRVVGGRPCRIPAALLETFPTSGPPHPEGDNQPGNG